MDKRKLESFLALARTLHFVKAASQVNITQPALSQHIQSLEQSWGVRLFERDKRHVSLTAAGKMVIAEVERTVEQLNRLSVTVRHIAGGGSTVLRLGYVGTSVLESMIVSAIRTFRFTFPDVLLEAQELSVREQFSLLQCGELDIGVIRGPMPANRLITHRIIQQQPLKLVAADNHAFHIQPAVRMEHLAHETLIILDDPEGVGLGGSVLKLYAEFGIIPPHIKRVRDVSTAVDLVALGAGITFIPATQLNALRRDVRALDICDAQPETSLFLCWKKGHKSCDLRRFTGLIS
ncbi:MULTISPECIES: LysR family transcriptional regulator [Pantoea]|uniref:LysR family transcriptional regulator n=1 Tax=Pantoea TaxID=53335 RepID=UPI00057EE0C2|nr:MULTISPECIES: LysR family transcriptional regulator [Pantoea]